MSSEKNNMKLMLTEDLSPHKIALLILIMMYCRNQISEKYIKPVMTVLIKFLENELMYNENNEVIVIHNINDLLFNLKKEMISVHEGNEKDKEIDLVEINLLTYLWNINSVDQLDQIVFSFFHLIVGSNVIYTKENEGKQILSKSHLGVFVYKIITSYRILNFDEVFLLYQAFVNYRKSSRDLFNKYNIVIKPQKDNSEQKKKKNKKGFGLYEVHNRKEKEIKYNKNTLNDEYFYNGLTKDLQDILDIDTSIYVNKSTQKHTNLISVSKHDLQAFIDKQINLLETYGTPTPKILNNIMETLLSSDSNVCLIQEINFNNMPSYYYIRYLENLHDSNYNCSFESLHQYFDYMVSNNSKYFYHFALISRASLHQFFGEDEKAIDAIEEAISVARENKDNSTLTYILSWLFNYMRNNPSLWERQSFYNNNNESLLLDFLIKKSQTVSLLLYSMSFNFETLLIIKSGGCMKLYLKSLLKALYISINNHMPTFIKCTEIEASVWRKIGIPYLSDFYNELSIESIDQLSNKLSVQSHSNFHNFYKGNGEEAYKNLQYFKSQVIKKDNSLLSSIKIRSLILSAKSHLYKGRFKLCKELIETVLDNDIRELDLRNDLVLLQIEVEIYLQNYTKALNLISEASSNFFATNTYLSIKLNFLKCKIFNLSNCYSKALTLVIQQLSQAKRIGFLYLIVEGVLILASILNNLLEYSNCLSILDHMGPTVLLLNNEDFIAHFYYELAQALFIKLKSGTDDILIPNSLMRYLNFSILRFKNCLNLQMLTKCFTLELNVALYTKNDKLIIHSHYSLEKLRTRSLEENAYGYTLSI